MTTNDKIIAAVALIESYLSAMEDRDLVAAKSMLGDDFSMLFPGDNRFETLEELV